MRKGALLIGFALLGPGAAADEFDFGVKAGVNLATVTAGGLVEEITEELERRTGLVAGLYARFPLGSHVSLQPEVLYSRKGFEADAFGVEVAAELDYLDVVLAARADFLEHGSVRPYLLAGPYVGIELDATAVVRVLGQKIETGIEEQVKDADFGVLAGGGLRFPARNLAFDLEARYAWGLSEVDENVPGDEVKNRVFSVMVGVSF